VNLKKKDRKLGYFGYEEVLPKLRAELDRLIAERTGATAS
jgi:(E)-4-hydroxy-3-methylbut-2-enyl-diphosphate synthase